MNFEAFVAQHYDRLMSYALYRCWNDQDRAQDLLHHTLLSICEGRDTVDWDRFPLTYIQLMMTRDAPRIQAEPYEELDEAGVALWQNAPDHDFWEQIEGCVSFLTHKQKEALHNYCQYGTFTEVAKQCGGKKEMWRERVKLAITKIRRHLGITCG